MCIADFVFVQNSQHWSSEQYSDVKSKRNCVYTEWQFICFILLLCPFQYTFGEYILNTFLKYFSCVCRPCGLGILKVIACVSLVYISDFTFYQFEYMSSDSKQLHVKLVFIIKKPLFMIFKYSVACRAFLPWVISECMPPVECTLYNCSGCSSGLNFYPSRMGI